MVESNKILTVSYGTFSCTLEGFDNPFGTMQSIAEYFRDLAAGDRFFGAEPPQPDAQMLHQIAEREARQRIEARVEDNGVVLRQMEKPQTEDTPVAAPVTAPAAEPSEATSQSDDIGTESVADKLARIRSVVAKARAERERTYAEDEPVVDAEDDSLLSAFATAEDAETTGDAGSEDDYEAEQDVDDESEPARPAADLLSEEDDTEADADFELMKAPGPVAVSALHDDDAEQAASDEDEASAETEAEPVEAEAAVEPETASETETPDVDTGSEPTANAETSADVGLSDEIEAPEAALQVGQAESATIATGLDVPAMERAVSPDALVVSDSDLDEAILAALAGGTTDSADAAEDDLPETEEKATAEPEVSEVEAKSEAEAGSGVEAQDELDDAEAPAPETVATEGVEDDADMVELEMEDDDGNPTLVRLTKAEFEKMLAAGEIEEITEDDEQKHENADQIDSTAEAEQDEARDTIRGLLADTDLASDEQDALAADIAALESEDLPKSEAADTEMDRTTATNVSEPVEVASAETEDAPVETADEAADAEPVASETETPATTLEASPEADRPEADAKVEAKTDAGAAPRIDTKGDSDLDRLLDEANSQMDEPETSRRRNAIQHLKRAVAATKADSGLRERQNDLGDSIAKFRDDLRQVVRPRRPEGGDRETRTGRPTNTLASGPLVLVSSQRVDRSEPVRPVKPGRPSAVSVAEAGKTGATVQSFSDFAAERGAHDLPDLLEAAAAYAIIVEGQQDFSRPQLLRRAASVKGETNMTREEGLKSFGQLLRAGKLRKMSAGRFALADDGQPRDTAANGN